MVKVSSTKRVRTDRKAGGKSSAVSLILPFLMGCMCATTFFINYGFLRMAEQDHRQSTLLPKSKAPALPIAERSLHAEDDGHRNAAIPVPSQLDGLKVLVALAAYDFSQMPHLEEVLDAYFDLCAAGSNVDVVVFATIPWPVTLIDMLNTRFVCTNPSPRAGFTITIHLKDSSVRLRLVDFHRPLFYEKIDDYDLFIYSEDDIRVSPKTVAAYMSETMEIQRLLGPEESTNYNVGVARYEYNYPPDIVIDDRTRHATQNVTRVYWEHSWHPTIPNSVSEIPANAKLPRKYVHMQNHHQGMYLATRDLLKAWRDKPGCEFDRRKFRPGLKDRPSQPAEGTQRVWMSSQQLYGKSHCGVQQLIPVDKFGEFTILHLPNKNYRRFGRKGRMGGHKEDAREADQSGPVKIEGPSKELLNALDLHLLLRKELPQIPQNPYSGIRMESHANGRGTDAPLFKRRMAEYRAYVERGGILSEDDFERTALNEDE